MQPKKTPKSKNEILSAADVARMGGLVGGKARMASLSEKERAALARKAGKASASSLSAEERRARALKASHARKSYQDKQRKNDGEDTI